ncbi:MAG: SPOR domain-containing protein [Treponema sp.]|nr:SPOR domain-containing protein [Treponema sp.]
MEQKKTLWIIAGVSFFLLVVFGVAFIAFKPSANYSPTFAKKPAMEKKVQPENGWSNPPVPPAPTHDMENQRSDLSSAKVNDMVVLSENTTVYDITKPNPASDSQPASQSTTIDLNALKRELTAELAAQAQTSQGQNPQNINITVTMPDRKPEQSVVITSDYYTGKAKEEAPAAKPAATAPAKKQEAPAKTTQTVQKPAKVESKPAPAKTTAAPAPAPKTVTRFWVQVAAYTNKKTAENAREILSENKITSDIFTYQDNKNRLFYRVRVGPYTTKSEAEYWQAKISKISDFSKEQSFVTSTND